MVYAKPPFGGAEHVLNYMARYTHRVAISNHRLVRRIQTAKRNWGQPLRSWKGGFHRPEFYTPIRRRASTPLILRKSRMRKRARTDLRVF